MKPTDIERPPAGCASFRVERDPHRDPRLVMYLPCPLRQEMDQVEQLVHELNRVRLGEG